MKNINQIKYEWSLSNEDLEAMFQDDCVHQEKMELELGEYLPQYKRELEALNLQLEDYVNARRESLYDFFKNRNRIRKSCLSIRRAA